LINISDLVSRIKVGGQVCADCTKPSTPDYQLACRLAFLRYGLPQRISLDHDSAFYDNKSASPFPSRIHLWLIALGVQVRFIHKPPPMEHARIERHHQTIARQALEGQTFSDLSALQRQLQARILFLNQEFPTSALNERPPLRAFPQASHSGRVFHRQSEKQILSLQRVYDYLKSARWFRKVSSVGTFSLGGLVYNATTRFAEQTLEITFAHETRKLACLPEKCETAFHLNIKGLTKSSLIAKAANLPGFIHYQLPLPFG
jgi:hypothetical protein